jgi:hypothetical protein
LFVCKVHILATRWRSFTVTAVALRSCKAGEKTSASGTFATTTTTYTTRELQRHLATLIISVGDIGACLQNGIHTLWHPLAPSLLSYERGKNYTGCYVSPCTVVKKLSKKEKMGFEKFVNLSKVCKVFQGLEKFSKIVKIGQVVKRFSKFSKIVKIGQVVKRFSKVCKSCQKLVKVVPIFKTNSGKFPRSFHIDSSVSITR